MRVEDVHEVRRLRHRKEPAVAAEAQRADRAHPSPEGRQGGPRVADVPEPRGGVLVARRQDLPVGVPGSRKREVVVALERRDPLAARLVHEGDLGVVPDNTHQRWVSRVAGGVVDGPAEVGLLGALEGRGVEHADSGVVVGRDDLLGPRRGGGDVHRVGDAIVVVGDMAVRRAAVLRALDHHVPVEPADDEEAPAHVHGADLDVAPAGPRLPRHARDVEHRGVLPGDIAEVLDAVPVVDVHVMLCRRAHEIPQLEVHDRGLDLARVVVEVKQPVALLDLLAC
mmetsp:Transcript_32361/g.76832  ORF Transcript_32361/g.76832 Transcript_32361/m.76832 type:complete len:282 (-) Transcript_32361:347-1192(-)